jgi:CIC family chloride channel protein
MYMVLGFFCALVAWAFTKTLYWFEDLFDEIKFPEYLKACIGGLILGTMGLLFPHILGVGYPAMDLALAQELSWWLLFMLVIVKILATSITIGSGGSGGIFAPSLFLGAMAGGFYGILVHRIFPTITAAPGAYSIVGMGAVVAGTTHGPLSAILILFEMTGDYKIILPLMITCILATLISRQISYESIYTLKLIRRGVNIEAGREINLLKSILVRDVMNPYVETVPEDMKLGRLAEKIAHSKHNSFPVVDQNGNLTGILSFPDYQEAIFDENLIHLIVARDIATPDVVTVSDEDHLYDALEKITLKDFAILPVVSSLDTTKLLGVLTRRDIISAYDKAVIKKTVFKR